MVMENRDEVELSDSVADDDADDIEVVTPDQEAGPSGEESEEYSLKKDCILRLSNLLEHEKNRENVIEYVKKLGKFLQIRLSYDGKKFRLENKVVLENKIEEKLLKELVINYKKH